MMFRYTGLSPSLVFLSRNVLLHNTLKSSAALLHRHELSYYAKIATPVSFKSQTRITPYYRQHNIGLGY